MSAVGEYGNSNWRSQALRDELEMRVQNIVGPIANISDLQNHVLNEIIERHSAANSLPPPPNNATVAEGESE